MLHSIATKRVKKKTLDVILGHMCFVQTSRWCIFSAFHWYIKNTRITEGIRVWHAPVGDVSTKSTVFVIKTLCSNHITSGWQYQVQLAVAYHSTLHVYSTYVEGVQK